MLRKLNYEARGPWSKKEDASLLEIIKTHKPKNWATIASILGTRCAKQCRERWHNHLRPNINKVPLSEWEEESILKLQAKHGNKWSLIARKLPGRTDNMVKNFFNSYKNRKEKRAVKNIISINFSSNTTNSCSNNIRQVNTNYDSFKKTINSVYLDIPVKNTKNLDTLAELATRCYYKYAENKELTQYEIFKYPSLATILYDLKKFE